MPPGFQKFQPLLILDNTIASSSSPVLLESPAPDNSTNEVCSSHLKSVTISEEPEEGVFTPVVSKKTLKQLKQAGKVKTKPAIRKPSTARKLLHLGAKQKLF